MVEMKLGRWQKWEMSLGQEGPIDIDQLQPMSFLMEGTSQREIDFLHLSGRGGDPAAVTRISGR